MTKLLQRFELKKFIKRAALITLLLALVEVFIYFLLAQKKEHKTLLNTKQVAAIKNINDSTIKQEEYHKSIAPQLNENYNYKIHKLDSSFQPTQSSIQPDTIDLTQTSNQHVDNEKIVLKFLSKIRMNIILQEIRKENKKYRINHNCVQVRKASNSNAVNAFSIAEFLKSKGYIITGRMVIPLKQNGIKITKKSGCIELTIGKI